MDVETLNDLHFVWYHRIIPLLQEYFYEDGTRLQFVLGEQFVRSVDDGADGESSPFWGKGGGPVEVVRLDGDAFREAILEV